MLNPKQEKQEDVHKSSALGPKVDEVVALHSIRGTKGKQLNS